MLLAPRSPVFRSILLLAKHQEPPSRHCLASTRIESLRFESPQAKTLKLYL